MSRTYRKKPRCFRKPTTLNAQKIEQKAFNCIVEAGHYSVRLAVRANRSSGAIPSSYDDLHYATREREKPTKK